MNSKELMPVFSPWLFWDSNLALLDFKRDKSKVIRRVFDLGLIDDVTEALWFYTDEEIIEVLTKAAYLPQNALLLAQTLFDLQPTDFACYDSKQLHPLS